MHILWFTGVQFPAVTGAGLNRAGWQEGLRAALFRHAPDIRLSIASFGPEPYEPFQVENATYYNILREEKGGDRWQRMFESWKHRSYEQVDLTRIVEICHQVQPDLVFIFGTENPFGLAADEFGVPSVISIQAVINGLVDNLFFGFDAGRLIKEFFSRQTLIGQGIYHKWWSHKKHARVERQIYQKNGYFSGRTKWDHAWMTRLNPAARYYHIDRVLRDPFYLEEWVFSASSDSRIFSLCGNAPFKGAVTLVRALVYLKQKGLDGIKLRLAGVDPDSTVGITISEILAANKMENQVDLLGRLRPDEIIAEMKQARVFVLPSHMDNSPNSLAEAMILGMPCVASNAGGISSMIREGMDGLLYAHAEIPALADRISMVLNDPDLARRLGKNAREIALKRHDPFHIASLVRDMYQEVLSREGRV